MQPNETRPALEAPSTVCAQEELNLVLSLRPTLVGTVDAIFESTEERAKFFNVCENRPAYVEEKSFCDLVNTVMSPIRTKRDLVQKAGLIRVLFRLYHTFVYSRSGVKEYTTEAGTRLIIQYKCKCGYVSPSRDTEGCHSSSCPCDDAEKAQDAQNMRESIQRSSPSWIRANSKFHCDGKRTRLPERLLVSLLKDTGNIQAMTTPPSGTWRWM